MPSRTCQAGDTVFVRATVIEAASDYFQILIDDGKFMSITSWAPACEVARFEDIGQLKPIRRGWPRSRQPER
jgi:hypothetical protein